MNAKVASDVDIDFHVDLESNPSWGEVEVEVEVNWKPGSFLSSDCENTRILKLKR